MSDKRAFLKSPQDCLLCSAYTCKTLPERILRNSPLFRHEWHLRMLQILQMNNQTTDPKTRPRSASESAHLPMTVRAKKKDKKRFLALGQAAPTRLRRTSTCVNIKRNHTHVPCDYPGCTVASKSKFQMRQHFSRDHSLEQKFD